MFIARTIDELADKTKKSCCLSFDEKLSLFKQAEENYKPGDVIYVFFNEDEVDLCNSLSDEVKKGLGEILNRRGEVGAVYHKRKTEQFRACIDWSVARNGH